MKKIAAQARNQITRVIRAGVRREMPYWLSRDIRMVNMISLLAVFCTLPFMAFNALFPHLFWVAAFACAAFLLCIGLNRKGRYPLAANLLILTIQVQLWITGSSLGREAGVQLMYIPFILGILLLSNRRPPFYSPLAILFLLAGIAVLELTDYSLLLIPLSAAEQYFYYLAHLGSSISGVILITWFYSFLTEKEQENARTQLRAHHELQQIINYFATSLFGKNQVNEILWDVAKNCISRLDFMDCVIYLVDESRQVLVQKAAHGPKNPQSYEILQPIEIPIGKGIVGSVAATGQPEIIADTSLDTRYIVDDERRYSEITVPIIYQDKVIGVIDSEHPRKNFFTETHLNALTIIASLCANKIIKAQAETEKRKAHEAQMLAAKLKELDQVKTNFFTNISHEFRTPLTLILGPLENKLATVTDELERKELRMMHRNAQRLLRLINQLLDLSKLESNNLRLEPKPGNVFHFIRSIAASFESLAQSRNIHFHYTVPQNSLWVSFDPDKLEKIIFNLLSNAFKFTPDYGIINVSASLDPAIDQAADRVHIQMEVQDSGIGIAPDQLSRIFDRFYQANHTQVRTQEGTGIGLALTRELILLHGGQITVQSRLGEGSYFSISLPLAIAQAPGEIPDLAIPIQPYSEQLPERDGSEPIGNDASLPPDRQAVILIVEDNADLRQYIRENLENQYSIIEATDGEMGLSTATQAVPDLIISDWMMPRMDGLAFCQQIKADEKTSHIPVIILTARANIESRIEGLTTGADDYIAKPFDTRELAIRVENLITSRRKLREQFSQILTLQPQAIPVTSIEEKFIRKAISVVEQHMCNPDFGIELFQEEMCMSRMQLHRKLKALTNQSASEFIRGIRLKQAAHLMQERFGSVTEIAFEVGFNNLSYFSKCFREMYGELPSDYAARFKDTELNMPG